MDFIDVFRNRKSIRKFKSDPVPKNILEEIIKNAIWVPNWGNTQPWEIHVVAPDIVQKISEEFVSNMMSGINLNPDLPMPNSWPDIQKNRYTETGRGLLKVLGLTREDKQGRLNYYINMFKFFGAPNLIYICMDQEINPHYGPFDIGALSSAICMLAYDKGLGTCMLAASAHYPDTIRKHVNIQQNKKIVIGIAIGYPDSQDPTFSYKSTRDEGVISWCGY